MKRFSDQVMFVVILRQPKPKQNHREKFFLPLIPNQAVKYSTLPGYACNPNWIQIYFLYKHVPKPIYNLPFQVKSPSPAEIVIGHLQGQSL